MPDLEKNKKTEDDIGSKEKNLMPPKNHMDDSDSNETELSEMIEQMPPEERREIRSFLGMIRSQSIGSTNPLLEKFTPEHIDKYLDYIQRDDDNEYYIKKTNRWFYLAYFVIVLVVFSAAVVYLLPLDKSFLELLIQLIIVLAGGIGAGYGLKSRKDK